jgi:beta-glucosidase/6-phospho-beta-glucosidase/beta-galactosidase
MRWKKRWAGADVRGYYPWSFIDLLSWLNGYQKQYGFVYVDHQQNLARKRKRVFLVSKRYCQPGRTALIFSPRRRPAPDLVLEYS